MFYNNEIATLTLVTSFILSEMYLAIPYFLCISFVMCFHLEFQNLCALHLSIFSCIFSYKIAYFFSFKKFNRLFLSSCSFMKNFSGKYREVPYIYLFSPSPVSSTNLTLVWCLCYN